MFSLPRSAGYVGFPVEGFKERMTTHTNLRIYFVHHHVQDTIVIMEEENLLHP